MVTVTPSPLAGGPILQPPPRRSAESSPSHSHSHSHSQMSRNSSRKSNNSVNCKIDGKLIEFCNKIKSQFMTKCGEKERKCERKNNKRKSTAAERKIISLLHQLGLTFEYELKC